MTKQMNETTPVPVLVSWSSGKDSAWTLHTLRQQPEDYDVRGIFTTVTKTFERVSIHSTPMWVLKQQAAKLGVPLYEIPIPYPCSHAIYEEAMRQFSPRWRPYLNIWARRTLHLVTSSWKIFVSTAKINSRGPFYTDFPVWGEDTTRLAEKMITSGMRAIVTALNPTKVPADFAGRWFDAALLADLPEGVDPLGENGEFHTCVVDGPMFSSPIAAKPGEVVQRGIVSAKDKDDKIHTSSNTSPTYVYADVVPLDE